MASYKRKIRRRRTKSNKRRNNKTFKQKFYNMKGCSKLKQKSRRGLSGGSSPLIGSPWSSNQTSLSNHYANNLYNTTDVQTQMQLNGGSRRRRNKRRRLRGGGLSDFLPADITNLGRDLMYNSSSAYSSLVGAEQPINPSATHGQLTSSIAANRVMI